MGRLHKCGRLVAMLLVQELSTSTTNAFTSRTSGDGCYFTFQTVVPPLTTCHTTGQTGRRQRQQLSLPTNSTSMAASSNTWTIPYSRAAKPKSKEGPLEVVYTNDPKVVNHWMMEHVPMDGCSIGFDTESVPDAPWVRSRLKGRPVTVQLATTESSLVIHLLRDHCSQRNNDNSKHRTSRRLSYSRACIPLIEAVLSDESIVKCGCSVDDDLSELRQLVPGMESLDARSRLDLGLLGVSKERLGLKTLTRRLLDLNLKKSKRIALSNWGCLPLNEYQIEYSARDAWAGAAVLEELAVQDPFFETQALVEVLSSQASLADLGTRKIRRKKAKRLLSRYQTPYHRQNAVMPAEVAEKVSYLQGVLRETQVDSPLGFICDE